MSYLNSIRKIVFIGSGNLATSLALALHKAGYVIEEICSMHVGNAKQLADKVGAGSYTTMIHEITEDADLYIIAVPDKEIENVLKKIRLKRGFIVHTSGTTSINVFESYTNTYGILYPLQTFSKENAITDFKQIPIFIEANQPEYSAELIKLAKKLSNHVFEIDSQQRLSLHVSAVYACNFVNYLLGIATEIMVKNGLDKDLLNPLIHETVKKALSADNPYDVQTGPASRLDMPTLTRHFEYLNENPAWLNIYRAISDAIIHTVAEKEKNKE